VVTAWDFKRKRAPAGGIGAARKREVWQDFCLLHHPSIACLRNPGTLKSRFKYESERTPEQHAENY
jgi:hypothetical protein